MVTKKLAARKHLVAILVLVSISFEVLAFIMGQIGLDRYKQLNPGCPVEVISNGLEAPTILLFLFGVVLAVGTLFFSIRTKKYKLSFGILILSLLFGLVGMLGIFASRGGLLPGLCGIPF